MKIAVVNGCFDIVHAAHVHMLEQAKALGDRLIVLVNDDASVEQRKGRPPANCLRDRIAVLKALRCVDGVVSFGSEDQLLELLLDLRPEYLVKGAEYRGQTITGAGAVEGYGGRIVFVPSLTEQRSSVIRAKIERL